MTFYLLDDFQLSPSGTLREAAPNEAIIQDIEHMLEELEAVGEPASIAGEIQAQIYLLLSAHPNVRSIEGVNATPDPSGADSIQVDVYVNGAASPIRLNTGG
jgi:hypothetical protein